MTMEQTRVRLANGIELDVVDEGPKDAPALIFLHGFPESHRTWRHQIPHFSDRFRCIAPDQRGYCGSSKPQDVDAYSPDKLIGDIFQLADGTVLELDELGHLVRSRPHAGSAEEDDPGRDSDTCGQHGKCQQALSSGGRLVH